jgi:hypothetical protein
MEFGQGTTRTNLKYAETEVFNIYKQDIINDEILMLPKPYNLQLFVYNNKITTVTNKLFW